MEKTKLMSLACLSMVLTACASPHLVTDASGKACHANYATVKAQYGSHFARACDADLMANEDTLQTLETRQQAMLMADPHSFDSTNGIYTREGLNKNSQYYWTLPYGVIHQTAVKDSRYMLEARWHNQVKSTVRLYVYDRRGRDISSISLFADGQTFNQVAMWPAENMQGQANVDGSRQYFDVPYATLKQAAQAHEAKLTIGFVDGHSENVWLVSQGEPSEASAAWRRLFNAIETR